MKLDLGTYDKMTAARLCETALATDDETLFWLLAGMAAGRISSVRMDLAQQGMEAGRAWDVEKTKEILRGIWRLPESQTL